MKIEIHSKRLLKTLNSFPALKIHVSESSRTQVRNILNLQYRFTKGRLNVGVAVQKGRLNFGVALLCYLL